MNSEFVRNELRAVVSGRNQASAGMGRTPQSPLGIGQVSMGGIQNNIGPGGGSGGGGGGVNGNGQVAQQMSGTPILNPQTPDIDPSMRFNFDMNQTGNII